VFIQCVIHNFISVLIIHRFVYFTQATNTTFMLHVTHVWTKCTTVMKLITNPKIVPFSL